jgi:hypothetical protein
MRRYLFVDEAGNFDFSPKGSRYFILTSICMDTCDVGHALLERRRELAWQGFELLEEFHATEERQAVRDEVFALIESYDFRIDVTIIEKCKTEPRITADEASFHQLAWYLHAQYVLPRVVKTGDELLIIGATLQTRKRQTAFSSAVDHVIRQTAGHLTARTAFWKAGTDPCIQVADYCSWAVQRKWERGDDRSYVLIKDKIRSEFDAFRLGKKCYY